MATFLTPTEREARYRAEVKRQGIKFKDVAIELDRRSDDVLETVRADEPHMFNLRAIAKVLGKKEDWLVLK